MPLICICCEDGGSKIEDGKEVPLTCDDCMSADGVKQGRYDEEIAKKFCQCYAVGHDKSKIKPLGPLKDSIRDEIDSLQEKEKENSEKAKRILAEREKADFDEQMRIANENPRESVREN